VVLRLFLILNNASIRKASKSICAFDSSAVDGNSGSECRRPLFARAYFDKHSTFPFNPEAGPGTQKMQKRATSDFLVTGAMFRQTGQVRQSFATFRK
jgi:hypothetical protein